MAVTASFLANAGVLTVFGDSLDNIDHRQPQRRRQRSWSTAAPSPSLGGTPTVANTRLIQVFGQGGNDTITLNEANGALPARQPVRRRRQRHR